MAVSAEDVKKLREETGAGMMDCKKALDAAGGDFAKAVAWLNEKGLAAAAKKSTREANEGVIEVYKHGGRMAVMAEINCETDFVARGEAFKELAHNIALQIAMSSPKFVRREDVPADVVAATHNKFKEEILAQGKPEHIAEKAAAGKMEKFYEEVCLLEQVYVKDPESKQRVKDVVAAAIGRIGENIVIRRFSRFELGETVAA